MKATNEEFQRVRESECEMTGHQIEPVFIEGRAEPVTVSCSRCGVSWSVGSALVENQIIGWLRGRAQALEDEAANAPNEGLPRIRQRAGAYREAAYQLDGEVNPE